MKKLIESINYKSLGVHLGILLGFVLLSLSVFYPILQGKELLQSDIQQYRGMSRQLQESRETANEELYWIDNAFGGMPTYQLGAKYPNDLLTPIHQLVRTIPAPAFSLFLYFLGAYLFLLSFGFSKPYAVLGAVAYGLSTYLLIIIQVGHNTKAQALGYLPFVFAAVHFLFKHKSLWGIVFAALAMGLQIRANHFQMTYYMLLLLLVYGGIQAWSHFKDKKLKQFFNKGIRLGLAGLLAIILNATSLLATSEYTTFSTRGKSELTLDASGAPLEVRSGLSYDYITQFSYGIFESLNLLIPRIQGGASGENLGTNSDLYKSLLQRGASRQQAGQFVQNVPTYWGDQPILEAPAYVGAVIVFLALMSLFFPLSPNKRWLIIGIVMSLLLSWGKNLDFLTQFFVAYFPLYSKFRAVSSIQVILEFCLPVLAMFGLKEFFMASSKSSKAAKNALKKSAYIYLGGLFVLYVLAGTLSFSGVNDAYYTSVFGADLMQQIVKARKAIYAEDLLRTFVFVAITILFLTAFIFNKLKKTYAFAGIALLVFIDLVQVSNRYLDRDLFVKPNRLRSAFVSSPADKAIRQDKGHYRVYEPALGLQGGRTAYFHNAIGGYHGAKPRRFEELIDLFQQKQYEPILNILNVKYILYTDEEGKMQPIQNPDNLGSAWFVEELVPNATADDVYQNMTAVAFEKKALVETKALDIPLNYTKDSLAMVVLTENAPMAKTYTISSSEDSFVVFSEMYYAKGWSASIDNVPTTIYPVNYVLRGLRIPIGEHEVTFRFTPSVIQQGSSVQLFGIILLGLLLILGVRELINTKAILETWE